MAVKHIPTNEVHKGAKGGTTACGVNTRTNAGHWVETLAPITCAKNGCRS